MAESKDRDMAPAPAKEAPSTECALEFKLAGRAAEEVMQLSNLTQLNADELVVIALSLLSVVIRGKAIGRRLLLTTKSFWPVKEFVLPNPC